MRVTIRAAQPLPSRHMSDRHLRTKKTAVGHMFQKADPDQMLSNGTTFVRIDGAHAGTLPLTGPWSKQEAPEPGEPPGRRRRPARGAVVSADDGDGWILDREGGRRNQAAEGRPQSGIGGGGQDGVRWGQAVEGIGAER